MRVILGLFGEELLAVGMVVLRTGLRGERRLDAFGVGQLQRPVDFIGRDVVETLAFVSFGQAFPVFFGGLEQCQCAHHVGMRKGERVFYRAVHVAFCQMSAFTNT